MSEEDVVITCGAEVARCICVKPAGHVEAGDRAHACDTGCGGSWGFSEDGNFEVYNYPSGIPAMGLPR